jgi:autotransporter-associated beta strand protein
MTKQPTTIKSGALPRFLRATFIAGLLPAVLLLLPIQPTYAGSATWKSSPNDGRWNIPSNWRPPTIPDGPDDTATFDRSFITGVFVYNAFIEVNGIVFTAAAKPYTIALSYGFLDITGTGVTNNSTVTQNFAALADSFSSKTGVISFANNATAGNATYTIGGSVNGTGSGSVYFNDFSSAGNASLIVQATLENDTYGFGGFVGFYGDSTAGNASFILLGNSVASYSGSQVSFYDSATVGSASFTINGGNSVSGANGGVVYAGSLVPEQGNATITINGGTASGANGGYMKFQPAAASTGSWNVTVNGGTVDGALGGELECDSFDTGDSTYTANGGTGTGATGGLLYFSGTEGVHGTLVASGGQNGGGGGTIQIYSSLSGASPAVEVFGNGTFDVTAWTSPSVSSLDGNGLVTLGSQNLSVGAVDSSSAFAGVISGSGGAITKVGTGTLTLSGANTYTSQTIVNDGTLLVDNTRGTGTGTSTVTVNLGTIGGTGIVGGALTVGMTSGTGAFLAPGDNGVGRLTAKRALTLNAAATYNCELNSDTFTADNIAARRVKIFGAAQIALSDLGTSTLPSGTVFTIISNTAATPIDGTFSNLADGSTLTVGNNTYLVSYEGGDGNDLTLTVQ